MSVMNRCVNIIRLCVIGGCALFGTAVMTNAETLKVKSTNPFHFKDILKDRASETIDLEVELTFPEIAAPVSGYPAIVFVHGSGGPQPHHKIWLDLFHKLGMVTARTNHFAPRGKGSAVGSHIQLTGAAMTADAFHILNALAADKRIDAKRISIMGSSKGGGVSLYTSWHPLQRKLSPEQKFAAHIALYPTCVYWDEPMPTGSPVLMLLGSDDNWTGADHCLESQARLNEAGYENFQAKLYPKAHHGFDSGLKQRKIPNAFNVLNCKFTIAADGSDFASGRPMDTKSSKKEALAACIDRGVTFGGNENALEDAKLDVIEFFRVSFEN